MDNGQRTTAGCGAGVCHTVIGTLNIVKYVFNTKKNTYNSIVFNIPIFDLEWTRTTQITQNVSNSLLKYVL